MNDYDKIYFVEGADVLKHFIGKYLSRVELLNLLNSGYRIEKFGGSDTKGEHTIKILERG